MLLRIIRKNAEFVPLEILQELFLIEALEVLELPFAYILLLVEKRVEGLQKVERQLEQLLPDDDVVDFDVLVAHFLVQNGRKLEEGLDLGLALGAEILLVLVDEPRVRVAAVEVRFELEHVVDGLHGLVRPPSGKWGS